MCQVVSRYALHLADPPRIRQDATVATGDDTVATRIKKRRQLHGLSHRDLGKLVGVDRVTVSRWENGHQEPGLLAAQRLVETLGGEVSDYHTPEAEKRELLAELAWRLESSETRLKRIEARLQALEDAQRSWWHARGRSAKPPCPSE